MIEVRQTDEYARWFARLRDTEVRATLLARVRRLSLGNPGDSRSVGDGVREMRVHKGPGYRVYYARRGNAIIVLLAGGVKATQQRDIERAKELARGL